MRERGDRLMMISDVLIPQNPTALHPVPAYCLLMTLLSRLNTMEAASIVNSIVQRFPASESRMGYGTERTMPSEGGSACTPWRHQSVQ